MREVFGFFKTKMGITRGAVALTSFQILHASSVVAWIGTC